MKTSLIICLVAVFLIPAGSGQTAQKADWRGYNIEEVIQLTDKGLRAGWTDAKVLEIFGQPDDGSIQKQFGVGDTGLSYKLNSGLVLRIFKEANTETKRYSDYYFATFQLIEPGAREDQAVIWTTNHSRLLTKEEKEERRAKYDNLPEYKLFPVTPPTDFPHTPPGKNAS